MGDKKIGVLIGKTAFDGACGHGRSVGDIAAAMREKGIDVIFTRYSLVDEVAKQAKEKNVDMILLSFHCGGVMHDSERLLDLKKEYGMDNVGTIVVGSFPGGGITKEEKRALLEMGIDRVFQPSVGTPFDVADFAVAVYG